MTYDDKNIFARIIRGELSCNKVYENEEILAFHDLYPAAPVHVLVLPKGKYLSFDDFVIKASSDTISNFFKKVREISHQLGINGSGYRVIMNHGSDASQTVAHFHVHILGKRRLGALVSGDGHHS